MQQVAALAAKGRLAEAEAICQRQLQSNSAKAEAYLQIGLCLQDRNEQDLALQYYSMALNKDPAHFKAMYSKGVLLLAQGKLSEAIWHLNEVVSLNPDFPHTYNSLGLAYEALGESDSAELCFAKALKQEPDHQLWRLRYDSLGKIFFYSNKDIEVWRQAVMLRLKNYQPINLLDYKEEIGSSYAMPFYYTAYQGRDNKAMYSRYAEILYVKDAAPPQPVQGRVGFVVTATTPMVFLTIIGGMLNHWDTARHEVVVFCYSHSLEKMREHVTHPDVRFVALSARFMQAAEQIYAERCHVLYYWEVGSDSTNYFLPYFRLAPIQCTSWGTFHTTGNPNMDYFLSSKYQEPPGAEAHYTEKLHLLEHLPAFTKRLSMARGHSFHREDFGFTEEEKIYLCPQHLCKIQPDFEAIMRAIALRDPNALIVFVESGKFPSWGKLLRERFAKNLEDSSCKIVFLSHLSRDKYFELIQMADVLLDTLHFGGGMTTLEAFSFGLPIVTLPGEFMRGRFTYACYRVMEIDDCIAEDIEDYAQKAFHIANDKAYAAELRQRISERAARLYENHAAVTEFQDFCDMAISKGK